MKKCAPGYCYERNTKVWGLVAGEQAILDVTCAVGHGAAGAGTNIAGRPVPGYSAVVTTCITNRCNGFAIDDVCCDYDGYVLDITSFLVDGVQDVTRTGLVEAGQFSAGCSGFAEDGFRNHASPSAACELQTDIAVGRAFDCCIDFANVTGRVIGSGACLVPIGVGRIAVTPQSASRILALDILQHGNDVLDVGGLAVGEELLVLVLAIIVLLIVTVTGIVVLNELHHSHDDGACLGTGHGLLTVEALVIHTGDNSEGIALGDGTLAGNGNVVPVLDGSLGVLEFSAGGDDAFVLIGENIEQGHSHVIAIHGLVIDGQVTDHGGLQALGGGEVGSIPAGVVGGLGSLDLVIVEGAGQHDDELHGSHGLIRMELAVLEALHDAELGALHDVIVEPRAGLDVIELGDQGQNLVELVQVLIGAGEVPGDVSIGAVIAGLAIGGEGGGTQGEAHNECQNERSNLLHGFISFLS